MDLAIFIVLLVLVVLLFKRVSSMIYFFAIVDIFLRIVTFIRLNIGVPSISRFITKYFPTSIAGIITNYSTGILETILLWIYVIIYIVFLGYITRTFIKKKK